MAGIYIHIPFCKQACHYCNFHFSTNLRNQGAVVEAMLKELELQADYLEGAPLDSIYLGGGTPSLLRSEELAVLFQQISALHEVQPDAEITLEANPDDLTEEKLAQLRDTPINRLSIGIQSFSDVDLQFMNRAHNATEAARCIDLARRYGFSNLTVDLIYGTPTMDDAQWVANIEQALSFEVPHLSCYCLTVEPRTALDHFVKTGKARPVDDVQAERQFSVLMDRLEAAGYEHYEISNFARPGWEARHNTAYWMGHSYLGIGPGAHSYHGQRRQWNVANNVQYLKAIQEEQIPFEYEVLTADQQYNEYILTRLRTVWGVVLEDIPEVYRSHFLQQMQDSLDQGLVQHRAGRYQLTRSGKLLADRIAMELFI